MARLSLRRSWSEITVKLYSLGWSFVGNTYLHDQKRVVVDEELWRYWDNPAKAYILWVNHINAEWFLYRRLRPSQKPRNVEWQTEGLFGPNGEGLSGETLVVQVWPSVDGSGEMYPDNWRFLRVELRDRKRGTIWREYYELCRSGELPDDDIVLEC